MEKSIQLHQHQQQMHVDDVKLLMRADEVGSREMAIYFITEKCNQIKEIISRHAFQIVKHKIVCDDAT